MMANETPDNERIQVEKAIAALEAQRAILGDEVANASIAALREKLAALGRAAQFEQRKLVSVMFMDIVDSTKFIQALDPEDSLDLIDTALGRLKVPVEAHGGRVMRYMGDGFMAAFGLETARENDAEMAIRAGLALLQAAQAYAGELDLTADTPGFQVRVGIDTGWVATGGQTEAEGTMAGATINLAARLESAAPAGGLLISHHTYQHVRGVFDLEPAAAVRAKGFPEPVSVYRVLRAKARSFRTRRRGVEGVETRMIGRQAEIGALQESFRDLVDRDRHRFITIVGEAGLGKSRLIYEFEQWVDLQPENVRLYRGRARLETQRLPYGLLRDIYAFRFNIQEDDSAPAVLRKLESGFAEVTAEDPRAEMKAHFVGHLIGYDFRASSHLAYVLDNPQQIRDRAMLYLTEYFKAAAEAGPVLVMMEDLHWADDDSLEMLERLSLALSDLPLLLVGNARPSLLERRRDWMARQSTHRRLYLKPLSRDDSRRLVDELLQFVDNVPAALRELVVGNAEGNPFYLEELVKVLIEDGVIVKDEPHWRVLPHKLAETRVPGTLAELLQARVDSLPEPERRVLQQASVVGRVFWDKALVHLNQQTRSRLAAGQVAGYLEALQDKELVFPRASSTFTDAREHIFKHAILRQVTYEGVLRRRRRAYHAQVAQWLMNQSGQRAGELPGLIADHLEQAEMTQQACIHLERAGDEAAARFANQAAVDYYSRALRLVPADDTERQFQLLLARERVHDLQGSREQQAQDLQRLTELAEQLGEAGNQAEVALRRANYAQMVSDYELALSAAHQALEWAQLSGDVEVEAGALLAKGRAYWRLDDYDQSVEEINRALSLAQAGGLSAMTTESLRSLGGVAFTRGDLAAAREYNTQALEAARDLGGLQAEAHSLINLGALSGLLLDYSAARSYFEGALALAHETGDRRGEAMAFNNLGMTAGQLGDYKRALIHYRQGLAVAREIGNRHGEGNTLNNLGWLSGLTGNHEAALAYSRQGLAVAREIGNQANESEALMALGHAHLGDGDPEAAAEAYRQALALRQQAGQANLLLEPLTGLARAALAMGDVDEAVRHIEDVLAFLETGGDVAGADEPLRIYLTCFQVLEEAGDPRAGAILQAAQSRLAEMAAQIPDEQSREMLLHNIPWHREILDLWDARQPA